MTKALKHTSPTAKIRVEKGKNEDIREAFNILKEIDEEYRKETSSCPHEHFSMEPLASLQTKDQISFSQFARLLIHFASEHRQANKLSGLSMYKIGAIIGVIRERTMKLKVERGGEGKGKFLEAPRVASVMLNMSIRKVGECWKFFSLCSKMPLLLQSGLPPSKILKDCPLLKLLYKHHGLKRQYWLVKTASEELKSLMSAPPPFDIGDIDVAVFQQEEKLTALVKQEASNYLREKEKKGKDAPPAAGDADET